MRTPPAQLKEIQVVRPIELIEPHLPLPMQPKQPPPALEAQIVRPIVLIEPPQPLPAQPTMPAPAFEIEVVLPELIFSAEFLAQLRKTVERVCRTGLPSGPAERVSRPSLPSGPAERVSRPSLASGPAERVCRGNFPVKLATFGTVIGIGPAPAPTWIGSSGNADTTPETALPIVGVSSMEPLVKFCRPTAGLPGDLADDGIKRSQPVLQVEEREMQRPAALPQSAVPPTWPE